MHEIIELVNSQEGFCAGNIRKCFDMWAKITNDREILQFVGGTKVKLQESGINAQKASSKIKMHIFSEEEIEEVSLALDKLETQNVITKCLSEQEQVISNIFYRRKKDDSLRIILNIKKLNLQLTTQKFKMNSVLSAIAIITPGCYLASIDLSNAYYSVPIHSEHRKLFKFFWLGKLYQFQCMPNSLCQAPHIFTKLCKPIYARLHEQGHLSTSYLDDSLLTGVTEEECIENVEATITLFLQLGFYVHKKKSILKL